MNKLIYIGIAIVLCSCHRMKTTEYGAIWPNKIDFQFEKIENFENQRLIATDVIYDFHSSWIGSKKFDSNERKNYNEWSEYTDSEGHIVSKVGFIRFYDNGNMSFLSRHKDSFLTREMFDPLKGAIGVYNIEKEFLVFQRFGPVGHRGKYINGRAVIKGDTLHLIEKVLNYNEHYIYIRKQIPDSLLSGWKANW